MISKVIFHYSGIYDRNCREWTRYIHFTNHLYSAIVAII